jgi:LysR family hydrogen peroxide-inducible transcriptional activator
MTLVQLEYIIALDTYRHFATAAEKCFVTQPTLSMQVQKLEQELGVVLFDRSKHPVITTEIGMEIIRQARVVLNEASKIKQLIEDTKDEITGQLRIGIIPTLAPYLLPLFLGSFLQKYPKVRVVVEELITEQLVAKLKNDQLDAGLLVTPLNDATIIEEPLFYEPFVAYVSPDNPLAEKVSIMAEDIDLNDIWLLNEGHCMRSQVMNFCTEREKRKIISNIDYETGSLETLKRIVELNQGLTLLPELATLDMSESKMDMVRYFKEPEPVREVSLVIHRSFLKKKLLQVFADEILAHIPEKMKNYTGKKVVSIK